MSSGFAIAPIFTVTWALSSSLSVWRALASVFEGHEGRQRLALELVRPSHNRRLGDRRVIDQRAFHLHGTDPVTGHVEHVVHPSKNPVVPVFVQFRAVAGEIPAGESAPVHLTIAVMVTEDGAQHARPRVDDREEATA